MMEGVGCGFFQNATMEDPNFANHSYIRIVEVGSGLVVSNIPGSAGFGFPNAVVDYENDRVWVFATTQDRCGNARWDPTVPHNHWVQSWQTRDLTHWSSSVAGGTEGIAIPNTDVARVHMSKEDAKRRGLPPHRWIMMLEMTTQVKTQFMINNEPDDDLTKGHPALTHQSSLSPR